MTTPTVEKLMELAEDFAHSTRISSPFSNVHARATLAAALLTLVDRIVELEAENVANMDTCKGIIQGLTSDRDNWKESTIASNASFSKAEQVAYDLEVERDKLLANLDSSTAIEMQENSKPYQKRTEAILNWYMDYIEKDNKIVENMVKSDILAQATAAFVAYADQYDTESNAWQDMGANDYFIAGYMAAAKKD